MKNYLYHLEAITALPSHVLRLHLKPATKNILVYKAGQYLEVQYTENNFHPFSIANAPQESGHLELHLRHLTTDQAMTDWLQTLQKNPEIKLRGPFGEAYLKPTPEKNILLLAGGTGFAYAKAILEQAIINQDTRAFHLYWGARTAKGLYLPELPSLWQKKLAHFSYTPVLSQAKSSWQGRTGYIAPQVIQDYPDLSQYQIYAAGPFAMIQNTWHLCEQYGLKRENMHTDMPF